MRGGRVVVCLRGVLCGGFWGGRGGGYRLGVLSLRRALWVIIVEQGKLYPFAPEAHPQLSGHMHLGLIWGSVMHRGVLLPTSFTQT